MPVYQDIELDFSKENVTGVKLIGDDVAIAQALMNILLTRRGELQYEPKFGSNLAKYLFEKATVFKAAIMEQELIFAIENYEPRVTLLKANVKIKDENTYELDLNYNINSISANETLSFNVGIR